MKEFEKRFMMVLTHDLHANVKASAALSRISMCALVRGLLADWLASSPEQKAAALARWKELKDA